MTRWTQLAVLLLTSGCSRAQGALDSQNAPHDVAIGPIPGPATTAPEPQNPFEGDSATARAGRKSYVQFNCYGCHGGHGGGGMGPSLRDADWLYGRSAAHIYDSIARGRAHGMPVWETRLPQVEIWRLVSYIQTLGTDGEIDPPR